MMQTNTQTSIADAFIALFRLLPEEVQEKLKRELFVKKTKKKTSFEKNVKQSNEFQKYLLTWPEMSDEEFKYIEEKRKHFNQWK